MMQKIGLLAKARLEQDEIVMQAIRTLDEYDGWDRLLMHINLYQQEYEGYPTWATWLVDTHFSDEMKQRLASDHKDKSYSEFANWLREYFHDTNPFKETDTMRTIQRRLLHQAIDAIDFDYLAQRYLDMESDND